MYTISQTLQTALTAGTPQRVLLEFTDASADFSNEDISITTGLELNEMFCSETDITAGLCPSAEIRFDMLNDEGQLNDFDTSAMRTLVASNFAPAPIDETRGIPLSIQYLIR